MNEQNYFLTIAIPTYNRAIYLGRALDSVLNQPHDGVEIIVSDNASEDDTERVVKEHMPLGDIKYIKNPVNVGPDANFLQCYEQALGKFVLLLGDDDLIVEGGIQHIKNFLSKNSQCDAVFVNHAFFENGYKDLQSCKRIYMENSGDFVTENKKQFMQIAGNRITFMSSLLISKKAMKGIKNASAYVGTRFIHTCIMLEATRAQNAKIGIITGICIAQDDTRGNSVVDKNLTSIFKVFGKGMNYVFCELAPEFDYDKRQMSKIYVNWMSRDWRGNILKFKCNKNPDWKSEFKKYGKPVLKKHPVAHIRLMPYLLMPSWFARCFFKIFHPVYQKIKGGKRK